MNLTVRRTAVTGIMLAMILAFQTVRMPQLITGTVVNSIFIFTLLYIGSGSATILAVLSPVCAFFTGILPSVMYPVAFVIMFGNIFFILLYKYCLKSKQWVKIIIPALVKSLFIGVVGFYAMKMFNVTNMVSIINIMFFAIQFVTSIAGIILGTRLMRSLNPGGE